MSPVDGGHARLRRGDDIAAVLRGRHQRAGQFVVLHAAERLDDGLSGHRARIAVIASRRVGGAVQRNRAKRRLRAAVRDLPLRHDVDVVLVARAASVDAPFTALGAELTTLAEKLGVLAASEAVEVNG